MGRYCTVCRHPKRQEIDMALITHAMSYAALAARYRLVHTSIYRHERAHLQMSWELSKELQAMLSADNLLAKLGEWHQRMEAQYANADAAGEIMPAVATARVGIQAIESFAKITMDQDIERKLDEVEQRVNAMQGGNPPNTP